MDRGLPKLLQKNAFSAGAGAGCDPFQRSMSLKQFIFFNPHERL
jgi:hypothetical protein